MRDLMTAPVSKFRRYDPDILMAYGDYGDASNGAFLIPKGVRSGHYKAAASIAVIASVGEGWEHVSASCKVRTPTWDEMMLVHRLFFKDTEVSLQYQLPPLHHVNLMPYVLHLWRQTSVEVPLPPRGQV